MENASKALIIAGAILISLLIISLGILIFNQAKGSMGQGMDPAEISAFNNEYLSYEGDHQKGSVVKDLIQKVNINNKQDDAYQITLESSNVTLTSGGTGGTGGTGGSATTPSYITTNVKTTKTYDVKCDTNGTGGRINKITIKEN